MTMSRPIPVNISLWLGLIGDGFPERAVQLIVSASPTGGPLDPPGLPQEASLPD